MTEHLRPTTIRPIFTPPLAKRTALELAHMNLLTRMASLCVPRIVGQPDGADLRDLADHMTQAADALDAYFAAIGKEVASNAPTRIDAKLFEHPCFEAIAGNATWEINRAADALDEDLSEVL